MLQPLHSINERNLLLTHREHGLSSDYDKIQLVLDRYDLPTSLKEATRETAGWQASHCWFKRNLFSEVSKHQLDTQMVTSYNPE